jgi:hypothetical protein
MSFSFSNLSALVSWDVYSQFHRRLYIGFVVFRNFSNELLELGVRNNWQSLCLSVHGIEAIICDLACKQPLDRRGGRITQGGTGNPRPFRPGDNSQRLHACNFRLAAACSRASRRVLDPQSQVSRPSGITAIRLTNNYRSGPIKEQRRDDHGYRWPIPR